MTGETSYQFIISSDAPLTLRAVTTDAAFDVPPPADTTDRGEIIDGLVASLVILAVFALAFVFRVFRVDGDRK